jgi:hypothetical protein
LWRASRAMIRACSSASVRSMPPRRRPRGHIRELPSGSFQAIVYVGVDPLTGKQRYERKTAPSYDAAQVVLTRLLARLDEDRQPKTDLTVRQAIGQWHDVAEQEDTTRDWYGDLIRIYIEPTFRDEGGEAGRRASRALVRPAPALSVRLRQQGSFRPHLPAAEQQHRPEDPLCAHRRPSVGRSGGTTSR